MELNNEGVLSASYDGSEKTIDRLDLRYGGMNGYIPPVGSIGADGKTFIELLNAEPYVTRDIIPFTMSLPRFMDYMPDPALLKDTHISLFELHPETIEGIDASLTVETETVKVGRTNQVLRTVTGINRPECNVSYTLREKHNKPVQSYLELYIRYGIGDEITKEPLVSLMPNFPTDKIPTPLELKGFSTLFVEPDYSRTKVQEAYLVIGQYPTSAGEKIGKLDINGNGEMKVYTIETGGYMVYGPAIIELGQTMLDRMKSTSINPDTVISPIDPNNLEAAITDSKFNIDGATARATAS
jgi:hypothetical protein